MKWQPVFDDKGILREVLGLNIKIDYFCQNLIEVRRNVYLNDPLGFIWLDKEEIESAIPNDELSEIINALNSKNFETLSKTVQTLSCPDAFFSVLYKNIDKLFSKPEQISRAIVILAKYQDMGTRVRDKYLNILACFCELNAIC